MAPAGYAALICAIVFMGGMLMLMLGLIGEYIGRMYISMNNSPQYVIKEKYLREFLLRLLSLRVYWFHSHFLRRRHWKSTILYSLATV